MHLVRFLNYHRCWKKENNKDVIQDNRYTLDTAVMSMKLCVISPNMQSTLDISKSKGPSEHFEISALRHIRFAELRKIPIEQPNFTNGHVI